MKTPQEEAQAIIQEEQKEDISFFKLIKNDYYKKYGLEIGHEITKIIIQSPLGRAALGCNPSLASPEFPDRDNLIKALLQNTQSGGDFGRFGLSQNPALASPDFPDRDNLIETLLQRNQEEFYIGRTPALAFPFFHNRENIIKRLLQTPEGQLSLGQNQALGLPDFPNRDELIDDLLKTESGQEGLGKNRSLKYTNFHNRLNLLQRLLQTPKGQLGLAKNQSLTEFPDKDEAIKYLLQKRDGQLGLGQNSQLASPNFPDRDKVIESLLKTKTGQIGLGQNTSLGNPEFPDRNHIIENLLQTADGQIGLGQNIDLPHPSFFGRDNLIKTLLTTSSGQEGLGTNKRLKDFPERKLIIQELLKTEIGQEILSNNPHPDIQRIKTEFDLHNFLTENPLSASTITESNASIITALSTINSIPSTRESIHEQIDGLVAERPELKPLAPEMKANIETLDQIPELKRAIALEVKTAEEKGEPNPLEVIERATKSLEQGTARQADEIKELAKVSPDGAYVYNQVYKGLSYLPLLLPATKGGLLKHGLSSKLGQSIGLSLNVLAGLEKMVDGGVISGIAAVAGLGITKDAGVNLVTAIDQKHQLKKAEKGQAQIAEIQQVVTPDDELEAMKKFAHPTARLLTHDYNSLPAEWGSDRENASSNMLEALYSALHSSEFEKGNFPHRKPVLDFDHGLQGTVDSAVSKTLESRMGTFSTNKKEKADARLAQLKIIDHNFLGRLPAPAPNTKGKDKAVVLPLSALQSLSSTLRHQGKLFNPETSSLQSIESRSSTSTTPSLRTAYKELKKESASKDQKIEEQEERIKRLEAMFSTMMSTSSQTPNPTSSRANVVKRPSFDRSQSPQLRRPSSPSNPLSKP